MYPFTPSIAQGSEFFLSSFLTYLGLEINLEKILGISFPKWWLLLVHIALITT